MTAILDFQSELFKLYLIYKSPGCFLPSYETNGLSVQEKKQKTDFQDGSHGGHLGFPIRMIFATFDLPLNLILPTKFQANWPFGSEEAKNRFSRGYHGGHLGFWIGTILAIFKLLVTLMLPTKFQVNWPFGAGEEVKNRFSRWISDPNDFGFFFFINKSPRCFLPSFKSIGLLVQKKK